MPKYKMPGKYVRRRLVRRKVHRKRKIATKLWGARRFKAAPRNGGFTIVRKLPVITATSGSLAGSFTLNDPTGACVTLGTASASPGTSGLWDVPFSMKFSLSQLQSFTDVTQIADQYKINSALVKLTSAFQTSTGTGATPPTIDYISDHDDADVPSLSLMREKMGVKSKTFGPGRTYVKMGCRPRVADEVFRSGVTTAYAVGRPMWINSQYPNTEHYAIKGVIRNWFSNGTANQGLITFDVSLSVSTKDLQ